MHPRSAIAPRKGVIRASAAVLNILYRCGAGGVKGAARAADGCNMSYLYVNYRYFLVNICIYAAFSGGAGIFGIKCKYLTVCIFARRRQLLTLLNPFPSECAAGGLSRGVAAAGLCRKPPCKCSDGHLSAAKRSAAGCRRYPTEYLPFHFVFPPRCRCNSNICR